MKTLIDSALSILVGLITFIIVKSFLLEKGPWTGTAIGFAIVEMTIFFFMLTKR